MSAIWLVLASLVWTGLIAVMAEWISSAAVRAHFAQGVWRGAAMLMALPWIAAGAAALWPAGVDAALPAAEALPGAAAAAAMAMREAETAITTSAGARLAELVGLALFAGWAVRAVSMAAAQFRLQRLKSRAAPAGDRGEAACWADRLGLHAAPRVAEIEAGSPFVAGLARRTIYIPACIRDEETRSFIIAHECMHLFRGDLLIRPFERLVADLLWFSPFAWHARRRLDYLREAVCDAETVKLTGDRVRYARALTQVARAVRPMADMPVSGFIAKRRAALPQRVKSIVAADAAKPSRSGALAAAFVAMLAAPLAIAQGIAIENEASRPVFSHAVISHERARVSSGFGVRQWRNERKMHKGVDIAAPLGTKVHAPSDGGIVSVRTADQDPGYGDNVTLHLADGRKLRFASLHKVHIEEGERVRAGDVIGSTGTSARHATGSHVHVELWVRGDTGDSPKWNVVDAAAEGVPLLEN